MVFKFKQGGIDMFWAKSDGETLEEHTEKVKNRINELVQVIKNTYTPADGILKEIMEKYYDEFTKLLELIALWHDLGKISPYFQKNVVHNPEFENKEHNGFPDVPHSFLSPTLCDRDELKKFTNIKEYLGFGDNRKFQKLILSAIAFHHWREDYTYRFLNQWDKIEKAIKMLKNNKELFDSFKEEFKDFKIREKLTHKYQKMLIPPDNLAHLIKEIREDIFPKQKRFFILIKGFLHRADHFASASAYLENDKIKITNIEIANEKKDKIIEKIKKKIKERAKEKYKITIEDKDIWQLEEVKNVGDKNIFLTAPTGVGKTEFALFWSAGKKTIYTLPIRTAVNAMWKRLNDIFEKVGLLHSDALFYLEDLKDTKREEGFSESFRTYELAKSLSYPVIVSTADQIFPTGLKYPGYEKIYSTLAYSYVVVDEIHLYDPRIAAIIIKTLEEITKLGGKFCVMSATLPEFYKKELKNRKVKLEEIYYEGEEMNKHKIRIKEEGLIKEKEIKKKEQEKKKEYEFNKEIYEEIKKFIKGGKKVLIVLNTVKASQKVFEGLKKKILEDFPDKKIELIHSRFTFSDRKEKEEKLDKKDNYPDILITTQVAEVSLDIDYDVLFTELAPMDALFQRMGRVYRGRNREIKEGEEPNIYICGKIENNELKNCSWEGVYEKYTLIETWELLKDQDENILTEKDKKCLINDFYERIEETHSKKFKKMLDILDSLWSADSKKEAQRIFRDIIQISGIPEDKYEEFKNKFKKNFEEMKAAIGKFSEFYLKWREEFKNATTNKVKNNLIEELKKETKEYKEKRIKINFEIFDLLGKYLVNIYPDKEISKILLATRIIEDLKIEASRLKRWIHNIFEDIYVFQNVRYNRDIGVIIIELEERIL